MPYIIDQAREYQIPFKRRLYVIKCDGGYALYHGKSFLGHGIDWLGTFGAKESAMAEKERIENSTGMVIRVRCDTK